MKHMRTVFPLIAILILCAKCMLASDQKLASLNLSKRLGGNRACTTPGSAQFISEKVLLLLVGPDAECYRAVRQLELVVLATNGQILARKPWSSTVSGVVLPDERIVLYETGHLLVLDSHLKNIQTIDLPISNKATVISLKRIGTDLLAAKDMRGPLYKYSGNPLRLMSNSSVDNSVSLRTFTLQDGSIIELSSKSLIETNADGHDHDLSTLSWVNPCAKYCQAYDAGLSFVVAASGKKRVLVSSNGSRFPVTDAAGLFPYFRIEVFDLKDGTSVYREQFITKTGHRSADISPDGDLLLFNDGSHIEFRQLD